MPQEAGSLHGRRRVERDVRPPESSGSGEGVPSAERGVLHEGGDSDRGTVEVRVVDPPGSEDRSGGGSGRDSDEETASRGSSDGVSNGSTEVSSWAVLRAHDCGQLGREEEEYFRHGLFVGGARLWQDYASDSSLARRILDERVEGGLAGFIRWRRYDHFRRIRRLVTLASVASALSTPPLRGTDQGRSHLRQSNAGHNYQQPRARAALSGSSSAVGVSQPVNLGTRRTYASGVSLHFNRVAGPNPTALQLVRRTSGGDTP